MINSPLRYPGGKSNITPLIRAVLSKRNTEDLIYIEPFAGGAGVALNLLLDGTATKIVLNDYDKSIYSFWRAIKEEPNNLIALIKHTPVTISEWYKQKNVFLFSNNKYSLELAFATFFLNRTNRSGILNAGPIGGYKQDKEYLLNARYNKEMLIERIKKIILYRNKIFIYNQEIRNFIKNILPLYQHNTFLYFDPPYFINGKRLYKNFFTPKDHLEISIYIKNNVTSDWIMTYDDVEDIKSFYNIFPIGKYSLTYSASNKYKGTELIIFKSSHLIPTNFILLA
jgi:DNA adenine methylase